MIQNLRAASHTLMIGYILQGTCSLTTGNLMISMNKLLFLPKLEKLINIYFIFVKHCISTNGQKRFIFDKRNNFITSTKTQCNYQRRKVLPICTIRKNRPLPMIEGGAMI